MNDVEAAALVAQAQAGSEEAFGRLVERFRPELTLHCYRMLGRHDDAEDATQDCLLRVWRGLGNFRTESKVRTWLYRIATNVCLDRRAGARLRRDILAAGTLADGVVIPVAATVPWLEALPDAVLDAVDERQPMHEDRLTSGETVEVAFIAALQHLGEKQRAVFILRDVVGWTANETAAELDTTASAVNAALNRARHTMREVLGEGRDTWSRPVLAADEEAVVAAYVRAVESGDDAAIAALLAEDVVISHQPFGGHGTGEVGWYAGRETAIEAWAPALHGPPPLHLVLVPLRVNRQPALACYAQLPGTVGHRAFGLTVLRIEAGQIVEETNLSPEQFGALGLPEMYQT